MRRRPRIASRRERLAAGWIDTTTAVAVAVLASVVGRWLGLSVEREGERDLDALPEPDRADRAAFVAALRERSQALRGRPLRILRRDGEPVPHDRALLRATSVLLVGLVAAADLRRPSPLPGRRLLGLEVARADGRPLRARDTVVRLAVPNLVGVAAQRAGGDRVSVSLGTTALVFAVQLLDPELRTLGDRVAGTRLVVAGR